MLFFPFYQRNLRAETLFRPCRKKTLMKYFPSAIFLNVVEIVNCCCFFFRIVAKSPSFVVVPQQFLKICFWTLTSLFLFYLMGASLGICSANELHSFWMTYKYCNVSELTIGKIILQKNYWNPEFPFYEDISCISKSHKTS